MWSKWDDLLPFYGDFLTEDKNKLTETITRSATILSALEKFDLLHKSALVIHIVGADFKEGNSITETKRVFSFLAKVLSNYGSGILNLDFIGPNVCQKLHKTKCCNVFALEGYRRITNFSYYSQEYNEYHLTNDKIEKVDFAFCFNAGLWGYDSWLNTIELMSVQLKIPIIITSYNRLEACDDEESIEGIGKWIWHPETNPFASLVTRYSQSIEKRLLADNAIWQCIVAKD